MESYPVSQKDVKSSYKLQKETFMSGHTGQSMIEICLHMSIIVFMHVFSAALRSRRVNEGYEILTFLIEFGIYYIIPLFFVTIFSSHLFFLAIILLIPIPFIWRYPKAFKTGKNLTRKVRKGLKNPLNNNNIVNNGELRSYITIHRAAVMLITCLSILAVDFRIFPRKFAKVETWGISLMDLGVGFFVFSSGVVAIKSIKKNYEKKTISFSKKLVLCFKQSYMFFVIGFIRILITKASDYPEHVTEYGVHWNFFFTLGFLSLSLVFLQFLRQYLKSYLVIIALLLICNESLTRKEHVLTYVLNASRTNLISSNKEGLFSFIGYLTIYLAGIHIGEHIFYRSLPSKKDKSITIYQYKTTLKMFLYSILYFIVYFYFLFFGKYPISRRLANLPYVSLVSACGCGAIGCNMLIEFIFYGLSSKYTDTVPLLLHSVNKHGLIVFLTANIITGLVNSLINTLEVSNIVGFLILLIHGIIISGLALIAEFKNWSLKF
ncbi:hypothetical protein T552_01431 [Pneumocystis carinii B80]|uniref:GPI-anchored wall transfer protein n=1 Tax=Pneumocystis carinii (strain B80) TaxID=1408658 RepID=A0A0W4ZK95_PNEC8|nr:hypothetical protein T552_01431 [Pneumocystis carinii B80]KTW28801.1 hypothetical protein T552_01431 [Pneumocystis carinii B80]